MSLLFNMLSRLVIAFLTRSKHLLISWLQSLSAVILEPPKIKSVIVSIVSPSVCHEVMGLDALILVFWIVKCLNLTPCPATLTWLPRILFLPMDRDFLWELQVNSPWSYLTVIIMMPQINHLTIVLGYTAPLLYPFSNSELPSVVCTAHTSILLPCNVLYYSGFIFQKFPMVYALPREGNIFLFSNVVKGFKNYLFIYLSIIL